MDRVSQKSDGSYEWSCGIDIEYHRRSVKKGLWGCVILAAFILTVYAFMTSGTGALSDLWIALIPIAVVLVIALPLLYLQYHASNPHESYIMNEEYVKSGYGKSSVYWNYKKTRELAVSATYIEFIGKHKKNRIYIPKEDIDFVLEYVRKRLPDGTKIRFI